MLTDKSMGAHPFLSLLDTLNFSVDKFTTSLKGIDVGYSNLPSYEALESMYKQSSGASSLIEKIRSAGKAKIMVYDVETAGFGLFSQVRNLGAVSSEVDFDAAGNLRFSPMDVVTSAHMASSEMSDMNAVKTVGGVDTRISYAQYAFEKERLNLSEELMDLSTQEGRQKAASAYKDLFSKAVERDFLVGYNVQFDIQKVMMSASLIDEFANDKEAMKAMADFAQMIKDGKVINVLDLLRESQMEQAIEAARAAGLTGADGQQFVEKLIRTVYSDKALGKMAFGNVSPSSIENTLLSSNLIDLIEGSGLEGQNLIAKLAGRSGTHESITDSNLTQYILRFVENGSIRWGVPNTHPQAHRIAMNVMKSSSFITLTRFSDVEGMTKETLKYVQSSQGIEGIKLYDETRDETIAYNKAKKQWISKRFSTDGSTVETVLGEAATRNRILAAIDDSINKRDTELFDLGVGFQQQSRAMHMLDNVNDVISSITTASGARVGTNAGSIRRTAAGLLSGTDSILDDAFIRALGSTQEEIGFDFYYDSNNLPLAMKNAMNAPMSAIGAAQKAAYVKRLAEGGLANALLDPSIRRMGVELARATSDIPYLVNKIDATGGARRQLQKRYQTEVTAGRMTQTQFDEFLNLSDEDFNKKYASHVSTFNSSMKNVSKAASELGESFLMSQKAVATITKTGGLSVTVAPTEMLKKMKVTVDGRQVDFLSEEFLENRRVNKFSLSVAQDADKKFVNLILDSSVIDRTMAQEMSQQYMDLIQEALDLNDDKKLLEDGMFSSEQQIREYRTILESQQQKNEFVEQLSRNIEERGIGVAGVGGEVGTEEYKVASALETLMAEKGQGIRNQTKAFDEGMQIELSSIDENVARMQIRVQDEEIGIIRQANPAVADYIEDTRRQRNESNCFCPKRSLNGKSI